MKRILVVTFFVIIASVTDQATAELASKSNKDYVFDFWQRKNGLPQISVHSIVQDRMGYLWLGTGDGLARFDGSRFLVFDRRNTPELPSSVIRALWPDQDGSLWIATRRGLVRHHAGRFRVYTTAEGLVHDSVLTLHQGQDGRLWIGTEGGLNCLQDGELISHRALSKPIHKSITAILEDRQGILWVGTEDGLKRLSDGRLTHSYSTAEGLSDDHIRDIYQDRDGRLWLGTSSGLDRLENDQFIHHDVSALDQPTINTVHEDRDGRLWVGTESGMAWLDGRALRRFALETPTGFLSNRVGAVWEDHENSLWVGTGIHGLIRVRRSQLTTLGRPEGLIDEMVWTIYEDRSARLWIGTNAGLSKLESDGSITGYTTRDGLPGIDVRSLAEDRRRGLWVGTQTGGLARFRDGNIEPSVGEYALAGTGIFALLEDGQGRLWIGTDLGLLRLEGDQLGSLTPVGLPGERVWTLSEDPSGTVWVGSEKGLYRFSKGKFGSVALPSVDRVKALFNGGDETLWIGTAENGLLRYCDEQFAAFSIENGLFDYLIHQILDDGQGWLWMSSNQGIFRVRRSQLDDLAEGLGDAVVSLSYSEDHGMRSRECNGSGYPAGIKTRDGRLWFPTIRGVVTVDPEKLSVNESPPPVHIEEIRVDGHTTIPDGGKLVLPPESRELALRSVALSFINPEKIRYRYKLEGFDSDWVDAGGRRLAYYTNLQPGDYRFRVIASNSDGTWNERGATLELYLRPAFYQTWSFYVGTFLAVGLLILGLYKLRVKRLVKRHRRLLKIKKDLEVKNAQVEAQNVEMERFTYAVSHDLRSPLVTIQGYLGLVRQDATDGKLDRVEGDLAKIEAASSRMVQMLDELLELSRVGRVVFKSEEVQMGALAREAVDLVHGKIAEQQVAVDIDSDLPVVFGDQIRLLEVLQNLIDNAVKFMGDQPRPRILIGSRTDDEERVFFVRDNGMGIEPRHHEKVFGLFDRLDNSVQGTGIGLALVHQIIEVHGGRIWVESEGPGYGTTFCFTLG